MYKNRFLPIILLLSCAACAPKWSTLRYYIPLCDKWILADNSVPPFQIIAEGNKKGLTIRDRERYETVRTLVTDYEEPQERSISLVAEEIAREIAKAPLAHDGVPFIGSPPSGSPSRA